MVRVRVEPIGIDLEVEPDETVFAAARRRGFGWPTVCGGHASCKACTLEVREGSDALGAMSELERSELVAAFGSPGSAGRTLRLACQTTVRADGAVLFKRGVRRDQHPPATVQTSDLL